MRKPLLTAFALLVAGTSIAQARPNTLNMTCGQAAATVATYGAAVLSTGLNTFDRFVANSSFCLPGEYAEEATAPTIDTPYCPIGYTCQQRNFRRHDFY